MLTELQGGKILKSCVKNGSEKVIFRSVDYFINSEIKLDTIEFYLNQTVETELVNQAFEILKEKMRNEKYKLTLEGVQIVLILEEGNIKNLKKELRKCVEYIDSIVEQIRLDTQIKKIIRSSACVLGNLIAGELRVETV